MLATENPTGGRGSIRLPATSVVDLHMHSPVSDGHWTVKTLPPAAQALGLRVVALTDHDDTAGVPAMAQACAAYGIHLIPAVEVSTHFQGIGFHLLLYNIDVDHPDLRARFDNARALYDWMVRDAMGKLEARGKPLDPERSPQLGAETGLKLYHLVDALVAHGYAANMSQAYGQCMEVGASYCWSLPLEEAVARGHAAGGVAVIAHPGRVEPGFTPTTRAHLDAMVTAGLDGVEVFHSYHRAADVAFLLQYAEERDLLIGCGSDSHGPGPSPRPLTAWPVTRCRALLARCGVELEG
jgi:predicted metal-dependent phosphoesterase TrpH